MKNTDGGIELLLIRYNMKKVFLFVLLAAVSALLCLDVKAQTWEGPRFEVLFSGGGGGFMPFARATDEPHEKQGYSLIPEIRFTPLKWLTLGMTGVYSTKENNWSLGLEAYGNWYSRQTMTLYSGIGYRFLPGIPPLENGLHVTLVGCAYGRRVFGFAEIGAGTQYFPVRAGIGWRF